MPRQSTDPYIGTDALDHLARMNAELLSELWIMRDRLALMEHLLVEKAILGADEIDRYEPNADLKAKLEMLRKIMVENVVGAPYRQTLLVEELMERAKQFSTLPRSAAD